MNSIRYAALLGLIVTAICVAPLAAAPAWPADSAWNPVTIGGNVYVDPLNTGPGSDVYATPPSPSHLDLVGGIDSASNGPFATGYWYKDANSIMFRMRVDSNPISGGNLAQHVWLVFLNTNSGPAVDWALSLDNKNDNQVELVPALSGGPNTASPWNPVVLGPTPHIGVSPLSVWSRVADATAIDGSLFGGNTDYFVDLAFPLSTFLSMTGLNAGDPFGVAFATSADHININKDLPDVSGWSDPVPEPATLALLTIGGLGILLRKEG